MSHDTELETGCGITPIRYKQKSLINAWQWAIGLEWYLSVTDPWRVVMSTDHPNGGSFLAYPQIIRLLMDRTWRREQLAALPRSGARAFGPEEIDREYSLYEICIITRSGPARILGLTNKGHLGPGADADVTLYTPDKNQQTMFELPRYVIKAGEMLIDRGELREPAEGKTLACRPGVRRRRSKPIWPGISSDIIPFGWPTIRWRPTKSDRPKRRPAGKFQLTQSGLAACR